MPRYLQSAITAKEGLNFIRSAVESGGSLFIKIEQENDLGIDALIELIEGEHPLNKQIAIQIKSGASYYKNEVIECSFPIGNHRAYWEKHPLPVFGLVFVPAVKDAYWVNIKNFLQEYPTETAIRFSATEANKFNEATFSKLFLPSIKGDAPVLEIDEAFRLARSKEPAEIYLGLLVLFRRYPNEEEVWSELVKTFIERPENEIPSVLIYWLAHIPGHDDIWYFGETPSAKTRSYVRTLLSKFEIEHVIKLLSFIDPEEQIGRGTLGQSVEAIISSLPHVTDKLQKIIESKDVEMQFRESAALILAMNESKDAIPHLLALEAEGSWYAGEIYRYVKEYEGINPYA